MTDLSKEQLDKMDARQERAFPRALEVTRGEMLTLLDMAHRTLAAEARVAEFEAACAEMKDVLPVKGGMMTLDGEQLRRIEDGIAEDGVLPWYVPELLVMAHRTLAAEARVAELEATCAEMREVLEVAVAYLQKLGVLPGSHFENIATHVLSSEAGKGWLSPEEAEKLTHLF